MLTWRDSISSKMSREYYRDFYIKYMRETFISATKNISSSYCNTALFEIRHLRNYYQYYIPF